MEFSDVDSRLNPVYMVKFAR